MHICLFTPLGLTDIGELAGAEQAAVRRRAELAPLGVLTLTSILENAGHRVEVVDLNAHYYAYLRSANEGCSSPDFCDFLRPTLAALDQDLFGFSTMCSSYPMTVRIAQELRRTHPASTIIFGGPQASVVDRETLAAFPWIDIVVRGEADDTFPMLLEALAGSLTLEAVPGLTRLVAGTVHRHRPAPLVSDLDHLPLPAYHRYPLAGSVLNIPLELGRGCPYACTFCSTNDFFRRRFRLKSPDVVVKQVAELQEDYPEAAFLLVHDMFTIDRERVVAFCHEILASGVRFHWGCSARTDRVDLALLELMARAGCRGVFFGVETGSQRLQKVIEKNLSLQAARRRIAEADGLGIRTTVSLIAGFPEETHADFAQTMDLFVNSLRRANVQPQIQLLAPLAGTPLLKRHSGELSFDEIASGLAHGAEFQERGDVELIKAHTEIFSSFYSLPTLMDRRWTDHALRFVRTLSLLFPWLVVALHDDASDILTLFDTWLVWSSQRSIYPSTSGRRAYIRYFASKRFPTDFLTFISDSYLRSSRWPKALRALTMFYRTFPPRDGEGPEAESGVREQEGIAPHPHRLSADSRVASVADLRIADLEVDFAELIRSLRESHSLASVPTTTCYLASRPKAGGWSAPVQLSGAGAHLLNECDGSSVREIASRIAKSGVDTFGIEPVSYCFVGLHRLLEDGLVSHAPAGSTLSPIKPGGALGRDPISGSI